MKSSHGKRSLREGVHSVRADEAQTLVDVWEASVRATHAFLSEADIQSLKPLVLERLRGLEHLLCVRDLEGALVGFVGLDGGKIDALFVHPSWHRMGVGRRLTEHAVEELGATTVDVNEDNEQAIAFYLRLGFQIEGRSELDSTGRPFPLLHMRRTREAKESS